MKDAPLGPGGEDITWPNQVAPRGQKASITNKMKSQTSNQSCKAEQWHGASPRGRSAAHFMAPS